MAITNSANQLYAVSCICVADIQSSFLLSVSRLPYKLPPRTAWRIQRST